MDQKTTRPIAWIKGQLPEQPPNQPARNRQEHNRCFNADRHHRGLCPTQPRAARYIQAVRFLTKGGRIPPRQLREGIGKGLDRPPSFVGRMGRFNSAESSARHIISPTGRSARECDLSNANRANTSAGGSN